MHKESVEILLVDDEPGHRLLVRENLENAGVVNKIVEFSDGQQAVEYLDRAHVDEPGSHGPGLMLLDIKMPRMDGYAVLKYLRAHPRWSMLPVVMLTSTDDQLEVNKSYSMGASGYIVKPVAYDEFRKCVQALGMFLDIVWLPKQ